MIMICQQEQSLTRLIDIHPSRQIRIYTPNSPQRMPHAEILLKGGLIDMLTRVYPWLFFWIDSVYFGGISCAGGAHGVQHNWFGKVGVCWWERHALFE